MLAVPSFFQNRLLAAVVWSVLIESFILDSLDLAVVSHLLRLIWDGVLLLPARQSISVPLSAGGWLVGFLKSIYGLQFFGRDQAGKYLFLDLLVHRNSLFFAFSSPFMLLFEHLYF